MGVLLTYKKLCQLNKRLYERLENLTLLIEYHQMRGQSAAEFEQSKAAVRGMIELNMEKLGVMLRTRSTSDRDYNYQKRFEKALSKGAYYYELDEFSRHYHPYKPPIQKQYYRRAMRHF